MAPLPEAMQNLKIGETVDCRVIRVVPAGAIVALDSGRTGIIRNREMDWNRSPDATRVMLVEGDRLQACVVTFDPTTGHLELSRKRALANPWERVQAGEYPAGRIVRGVVVNLTHEGVYVEIVPGIDGILPVNQIPGGTGKRSEDLLWIGDIVEAVVLEVQQERELLILSILERINKRSIEQTQKFSDSDTMRDGSHYNTPTTESIDFSRLQDRIGTRIRQVCIVDDASQFARELAEWLTRLGYYAVEVKEGVSAEFLESGDFDLYLLDVHLDAADGREIAKTIVRRSPGSKIILMTALDRIIESGTDDEDLVLYGVLLKPLDYRELLDLLLALEGAEAKPITLSGPDQVERDQGFEEYVKTHLEVTANVSTALWEALSKLREDTRADAAYLLRLDPYSQQVSVTASDSSYQDYLTKSQLDVLKWSVVRHIAFNRERVHEGAASAQSRFGTYQRVFFNAESCIGLSLPEVSPTEHFVLLLNHRERDHFTDEHLAAAITLSSLLASYLRQSTLSTILTRSQRSVLMGQLSASLLHELRNQLNTIGQTAQNMDLDIDEIADRAGSPPTRLWAGRIMRRWSQMKTGYADLRTMTLENLGIAGQEHAGTVHVGDLLEKIKRMIGPIAKTHQVGVQVRAEPRLPDLATVPLRLEQVFLNVALNAVQQMGLMRQPNCLLQILASHHGNQPYPIQVRFKDDGPGIHKAHWDWVFKLGTTTRSDGSGLGLFVSKGLIESLGGLIVIEQSHMFVGTTLLIQLPLSPTPEVSHVRS